MYQFLAKHGESVDSNSVFFSKSNRKILVPHLNSLRELDRIRMFGVLGIFSFLPYFAPLFKTGVQHEPKTNN